MPWPGVPPWGRAGTPLPDACERPVEQRQVARLMTMTEGNRAVDACAVGELLETPQRRQCEVPRT